MYYFTYTQKNNFQNLNKPTASSLQSTHALKKVSQSQSASYSKDEITQAEVRKLYDDLYMSMEGHMKTENQPNQQSEISVDQQGNASKETRAMTLDRFLVQMNRKELDDFFVRGEFDLKEQKEDGTIITLKEEEVRARWEYLNKLKERDPLLAGRLPEGKLLNDSKSPKFSELPLKPSHSRIQMDESFSTEKKEEIAKKKIDPNILNAIKQNEKVIKANVEHKVKEDDVLKTTIEMLYEKQNKKSKLSDFIPFLKSQKQRNIAQILLITVSFVGSLVYYFSREDWLPKRVTQDDMDQALRDIQEIRKEYESQKTKETI